MGKWSRTREEVLRKLSRLGVGLAELHRALKLVHLHGGPRSVLGKAAAGPKQRRAEVDKLKALVERRRERFAATTRHPVDLAVQKEFDGVLAALDRLDEAVADQLLGEVMAADMTRLPLHAHGVADLFDRLQKKGLSYREIALLVVSEDGSPKPLVPNYRARDDESYAQAVSRVANAIRADVARARRRPPSPVYGKRGTAVIDWPTLV